MTVKSTRRASVRRKTYIKATARHEDATIPVTIVQISNLGMMIQAPYDLLPGTALTLEILDDKIPAKVIWSNATFAGLRLLATPETQTQQKLEAAGNKSQ